VKSAKDVPFGGFVKNRHPPLASKFWKFCITKSHFSLKTCKKSWQIRIRI